MRYISGNILSFLAATLLAIGCLNGLAQVNMGYRLDSNLWIGEGINQYNTPFTGGFNAVTVGQMEINFDGKPDLVLFDRGSNTFRPYINEGNAGQLDFRYAPEYIPNFTPDGKSYALTADFNRDGKMDLFMSDGNDLFVYQNTSVGGELSFGPATALSFKFPSGATTSQPISIGSENNPALYDLDGDNDLDIFFFNGLSQITLCENLDSDNNNPPGTMELRATTECWGGISKAKSVIVNTGISCKGAGIGAKVIGMPEHGSGRTLSLFDVDGDGNVDVQIGESWYNNLSVLFGDSASGPNIRFGNQDTLFPANLVQPNNTAAGSLITNPTCFYFDVNNDGKKDLIVAPGDYSWAKGYNNLKLFINFGTTLVPNFKLNTTKFLSGEVADVGYRSAPVIFDANGDGLLDIGVGMENQFTANIAGDSDSAAMALFTNIGSDSVPRFTLIDRNYADLDRFQLSAIRSSMVDIDHDGDKDWLMGTTTGSMKFLEDTSTTGVPDYSEQSQFVFTMTGYKVASPLLHDINGDSLVDMLLASETGKVDYFQDMGSVGVPNFSSAATATNWGGLDFSKNSCYATSNKSTPISMVIADLDSAHKNMLFIADCAGTIRIYSGMDTSNTLNPNLILEDSIITYYPDLTIAVEDINDDGIAEIITGTSLGGIAIYQKRYNVDLGSSFGISPCGDTFYFASNGNPLLTKWCDTATVIMPCDTCDSCLNDTCVYPMVGGVGVDQFGTSQFIVFPNPTKKNLTIRAASGKTGTWSATIYNLVGTKVESVNVAQDVEMVINIEVLPAGQYILLVTDGHINQQRFKITKL